MNRYLVEEHRARHPYGEEYVHWWSVIEATDQHVAFNIANHQMFNNIGQHFMYKADELFESTSGYHWVACDGSDCSVEVRDLGPVVP